MRWLARLRAWQAPDRIGRYGRQRTWELQLAWFRRFWFLVLGIVAGALLTVTPVALYQSGVARGLLYGIAGASGIWAVLLLSTVSSGAGNRLMGAVAEGWTAMDLRKLTRRGWVVVNGIQVRTQDDIDHVAIGPPGILAIETKWSADPWPLDGSEGFMSSRLRDAVDQALVHRGRIQGTFAPGRWGVVRAVVVLQSGSERSAIEPRWVTRGDVDVVQGSALLSWLDTLTEQHFEPAEVERIGEAVRRHTEAFDARQNQRGVRPRRTLSQLAFRWIVLPSFTIASAMAVFVGLASFSQVWMTITGVVVCALTGLLATRVRDLGPVAWPWTLSFVAILLILGCAEVVALVAGTSQ